jgi:hypothetical protein
MAAKRRFWKLAASVIEQPDLFPQPLRVAAVVVGRGPVMLQLNVLET